MSVVEIHARLANTAALYFTILAIWGLWKYFRKEGLNSSYWGALVIAEILILLQSGMGAYMWLIGLRPGRGIHILYGVVAAIVIPGIYAYTRGEDDRRVMVVYAIALLINVALIFRAMTTGQIAA